MSSMQFAPAAIPATNAGTFRSAFAPASPSGSGARRPDQPVSPGRQRQDRGQPSVGHQIRVIEERTATRHKNPGEGMSSGTAHPLAPGSVTAFLVPLQTETWPRAGKGRVVLVDGERLDRAPHGSRGSGVTRPATPPTLQHELCPRIIRATHHPHDLARSHNFPALSAAHRRIASAAANNRLAHASFVSPIIGCCTARSHSPIRPFGRRNRLWA